MNKKGNAGIPLFFIFIVLTALFVGFIIAFGVVIIDWGADTLMPEFKNLGVIDVSTGNSKSTFNASQASEYVLTPINTVIQQFAWMGGTLYVILLIGIIAFVSAVRITPNRWLMSFYFLLMVLLIVASILMSNIYEGFYNGTDEVATRLQEQTLLSFFLLHSPVIFTFLGFIGGIIMFSGVGGEER